MSAETLSFTGVVVKEDQRQSTQSQAKTIKPNATTAIMTATTICKSVIGDSSKAAKQQVSQPARKAGGSIVSHITEKDVNWEHRETIFARDTTEHNQLPTSDITCHHMQHDSKPLLPPSVTTLTRLPSSALKRLAYPPPPPSPNKLHKSYITLADP